VPAKAAASLQQQGQKQPRYQQQQQLAQGPVLPSSQPGSTTGVAPIAHSDAAAAAAAGGSGAGQTNMSQAVTGSSSSSSSMQAAKLRLGLTAGLQVAEVSHGGVLSAACMYRWRPIFALPALSCPRAPGGIWSLPAAGMYCQQCQRRVTGCWGIQCRHAEPP
jgi:hypothetical protein